MEPRRNGSNGWMVRLAAFLFVVQAALLGFSLGATADPLPRDQFGNVLCVTDGNGGNHKPSGKSDHHSKLMECCSMGCGMFGAPGAPPPTLVSLLARPPVILSVPFVLYEDVGSGAVETPRSTRGPPLFA
ncbi:DUF2946 family protein [uncultured Aureimonas sp.]|uniref:DUF2946 family protein n=1 Tax=uncultured Aureimonas sp. TaxID=1604662 RepID=UPI0025E2858B|nr:DUF2946 family protein [uncultured Aureimonas sp.]